MGFGALGRGKQRLARLLEERLAAARAGAEVAAAALPRSKPWERDAAPQGPATAAPVVEAEEPRPLPAARGKPWERDALPEQAAPLGRGAGAERVTALPSRPSAHAERRAAEREVNLALALSDPLPDEVRALEIGELRPGDVVDGCCEIERSLGRSRYYAVYRARHRVWDIDVVVKVPRLDSEGSEVLRRGFCAAAQRWTALGVHPNVAYCHYTQVVQGVPIAVIEHVAGGNLRPWIASGRSRNLRVGLPLALQICHGLERAHEAHLWHGALRPENCLIGEAGDVAVTDFGIAGRVASGMLDGLGGAGAEAYVAPECWADPARLDARVDIFCLGVCLYELFAGARPFETTRGPRRAIALPGGERSPLPETLAALLRRCVESDPGRRPQSVAEVRRDLAAAHLELYGKPSAFATVPPGSWDADGWNNRAVVAQLFGRAADAEVDWENALAADNRHLQATYNYGVARWRGGTLPDAVVLRQLENVDADAAVVAPLAAAIHCERGDFAAARRAIGAANAAALAPLLAAALQREDVAEGPLREWGGYEAYLTSVSLSRDGSVMSFASDDGGVFTARTDIVESPRRLSGHLSSVAAVSLGASGERAVSAGDDGVLRVWDLALRRCLQEVPAPGRVLAAAFCEQRALLALACSDAENFVGVDGAMLAVWDLERGRKQAQLKGHSNTCKAVAISGDGNFVVSGSDDLTVRVWDLEHGGQCRRVLEGNQHFVAAVAVSADGKVVVSGGWDKSVRVWNLRAGTARVLHGHLGIVNAVAVSADGRTVVSGGWDRTLRIWDAESGRCLRTIDAHTGIVSGVALSGDGRVAASVGWDKLARVWRIPHEWQAVCAPVLARRWSHAVLPSGEPDADELCARGERALRDGQIDAALTALRRARASAEAPARAAELWAELGRSCPRTEVADLRPCADVRLPAASSCAALANDGRWLVSGGLDGAITVWNADLGRRERLLQGHRGRVAALAMSGDDGALFSGGDDGALFSGGADGAVRVWEPETGRCARVLEGHSSVVSALAASRDGRWVLSGGYDHEARLWDARSGRCAAVFGGHERQIAAVALDVERERYAAADRGGRIRVAGTRGDAPALELVGHAARVTALCFGGDGRRLLSADAGGALRLWALDEGRCLATLSGHQSPVVWLAFRAASEWAASVGSDGSAYFWNTASAQATATAALRGAGTCAAALSCGDDKLLAVGSDGGAALWDLEWDLKPPA